MSLSHRSRSPLSSPKVRRADQRLLKVAVLTAAFAVPFGPLLAMAVYAVATDRSTDQHLAVLLTGLLVAGVWARAWAARAVRWAAQTSARADQRVEERERAVLDEALLLCARARLLCDRISDAVARGDVVAAERLDVERALVMASLAPFLGDEAATAQPV